MLHTYSYGNSVRLSRTCFVESKEPKVEMRQLQRLESELADHRSANCRRSPTTGRRGQNLLPPRRFLCRRRRRGGQQHLDPTRRTPGLTTVLVQALNRCTTRHPLPGYRRGLLHRLRLPRQHRWRGRRRDLVRRSRRATTSVRVDHSPATPAKAVV